MSETSTPPTTDSDPIADAESALDSAEASLAALAAGEPVDDRVRAGLELLGDVELDVSIELGRTSMLVEDVLKLRDGSVVELDKLAGDPVDVFVNGRRVARGEVLVLNDNFCIRVSEVLDELPQRAAGSAVEARERRAGDGGEG
ncbi:flagellar motor switch protein FliN [Phycisphaera mikurensis]|uniref:Flagellar motor switch protein FliN n=1 Tax=Phycisphaera mikurensis (strain NBRC 102666 / KCTC 22515 / FYK2301M01) TaxID=1142394 RepID=I0IGX5_PHYMF|nr:flagellar motor switch protein FliN [Phycisphaera mikurensis]MBB6440770.1 flagellar motor switch protein FliN/FliY [Phycisphaera mikurensis]BAM04513.1 flagellar motor switch protein FliN [Phycisphaera mikurensis NBRC 102666]